MKHTFWLLDIHRNIIADAAVHGCPYDLIEGAMPPNAATPPHIHHEYSETEYVLEGELTIVTDTETVVLKPGEGYTIPMGKSHYLSATAPVVTKTITVFAPGGFAQVIRKAGIPGELKNGLPNRKTDMKLFVELSTAIGDQTLSRI